MLIRLYKKLLPFARPYRGKMIVSSILNILSNAVGSVNMLALLPIVSVVLGEQGVMPTGTSSAPSILQRFSNLFLVRDSHGVLNQIGSLERICAFIFITYALKNIFQYASGYSMALVESGMARSLRDAVFEKLSKLSLDYYYDRKSGQLLSRLTNDVSAVNGTLSSSIIIAVGQPVQIGIFIATMIIINVKMTIVSIVIAALSLYLVRLFRTTIKKMSHRIQSLQGDILSVAQEMISGIKVVKSFGMESYEVRRFKSETEKHYHGSRRLARIRLVTSPINETLATLGFIGILWFGANAVFAHEMMGSEVIYFLAALISLMQPVKSLSELNSRLYEGSAAAENLFAILDAEPTVKPGEHQASKVISQPIVFDEVTFRYKSVTENAIDHIDLEIYPNEVLALVDRAVPEKRRWSICSSVFTIRLPERLSLMGAIFAITISKACARFLESLRRIPFCSTIRF